MRLLVVTPHFFGPPTPGEPYSHASQSDLIGRIAGVNAMMVALYRHFGSRRQGVDPHTRLSGDELPRHLDLVVLQVPGKGILDRIGIDPASYQVEYFSGDPKMQSFEAQRIMGERVGQYDYYAMIEDDMVINDPAFYEKLAWFERSFGPEALLQPTRYEMAQSGTPALVVSNPLLSDDALKPFRRAGQRRSLGADWHGRMQSFALPTNPHVGGYFVSDAQLRRWMAMPWFYDRDTSWIAPLESAASLSIGRSFDLYQCTSPDPLFLCLEHYGTRMARLLAPEGSQYGDSPILEMLYGVASGRTIDEDIASTAAQGLNEVIAQRDQLAQELTSLRRSRSKLAKALSAAVLAKFQAGKPG